MDFSNEFIAVFSTNYIECQKQKNKIIQQKPSVKIFIDLQIPSLDPFFVSKGEPVLLIATTEIHMMTVSKIWTTESKLFVNKQFLPFHVNISRR